MAVTNTLPNNYRRHDKTYARPIPDGLTTTFFLNTEPILTPVSGNLRLSVFDGYGTEVISNAGTIKTVTAGGGYRIYVDDLVITGLNYQQVYKLVIYNHLTNDVLFVLNCFRFVPVTDTLVEVSYRNSSDIFNINYEQIPLFRNVLYLDLNVIDDQPEYEIKEYAEASTGHIRAQKSQLKSYVILEAYFFDDVAHGGMKGLSLHDDILLNGSVYTVKEGYSKDTDIRSSKAKGKIEMWDQELNEINLHV